MKYVRFECRYSFLWVCCVNLSRSAAKKDLTEKYSVVIYEQIRFCEIKSNLNPHALSWYAEKEKASLSQGGLQTKPSSSAQTLRSSRKDDRIWVMTKCKSATESAEAASKKAGRRNGLQQKLKFQCSSFAHWKRTAQSGNRPLGTPVGRNGSQQWFPAERLFWKQAGTRKRSLGLFVFSAQRKGLNNAIWCKRIRQTYPRFAEKAKSSFSMPKSVVE